MPLDRTHSLFQETFPCPYFTDGREATYEYLIAPDMSQADYGRLLVHGFRRSGVVYYRTQCMSCSDCLPIRVDICQFKASKGQRKTLRNNGDIQVRISEKPSLSRGKLELYAKYLGVRHNKMTSLNAEESLHPLIDLHYGYEGIIEVGYFLSRRLIAIGIVDAADNALSANYFYYDTDHLNRRPGVFSILQEIALARALGKHFYYLGFYIEGTRKMSYKKYFRPNQVFRKGTWETLPE